MVFEKVKEALSKMLNCDEANITLESQFSTLGLDSLDLVECMMNLEDELGIEIELNETIRTVGDLITVIENKLKEKQA